MLSFSATCVLAAVPRLLGQPALCWILPSLESGHVLQPWSIKLAPSLSASLAGPSGPGSSNRSCDLVGSSLDSTVDVLPFTGDHVNARHSFFSILSTGVFANHQCGHCRAFRSMCGPAFFLPPVLFASLACVYACCLLSYCCVSLTGP